MTRASPRSVRSAVAWQHPSGSDPREDAQGRALRHQECTIGSRLSARLVRPRSAYATPLGSAPGSDSALQKLTGPPGRPDRRAGWSPPWRRAPPWRPHLDLPLGPELPMHQLNGQTTKASVVDIRARRQSPALWQIVSRDWRSSGVHSIPAHPSCFAETPSHTVQSPIPRARVHPFREAHIFIGTKSAERPYVSARGKDCCREGRTVPAA